MAECHGQSTGVIIFNEGWRTLLVKDEAMHDQENNREFPVGWTIPVTHIRPGETPEEATARAMHRLGFKPLEKSLRLILPAEEDMQDSGLQLDDTHCRQGTSSHNWWLYQLQANGWRYNNKDRRDPREMRWENAAVIRTFGFLATSYAHGLIKPLLWRHQPGLSLPMLPLLRAAKLL